MPRIATGLPPLPPSQLFAAPTAPPHPSPSHPGVGGVPKGGEQSNFRHSSPIDNSRLYGTFGAGYEGSGEGGEGSGAGGGEEELGTPPVAVVFSSATQGDGEEALRDALARGVELSDATTAD
eukprot:1186417-Prorocentrum_minimum.AAC.4